MKGLKCVILACLWSLTWSIPGGCESPATTGPGASRATGEAASKPLPTEDRLDDLDLGDDWAQVERELGTRSTGERRTGRIRPGETGTTFSNQVEPGFGIVLGTFVAEGHAARATEYKERLFVLLPELSSSLRIYPTNGGSMVVYGSYEGWSDQAAKADIKKLQAITANGQQIFPKVLITELIPPRDPASIASEELLSLRVRYPDIRVLYTLEIAIWGDFESGEYPPRKRRVAAERFARELRARGIPAYYHHDETRSLSMVTVGVFDHRAIDGQTGLKSPQVERFLLDFPQRMVNGESVVDLYDPGDPEKGGRPQAPRLVEVPQL